MSLNKLTTPPIWHPNAIATPSGWADPVTGELLITIIGLSTTKEPAGAPTLVSVTADKAKYKRGDTLVVIAQFSEAVVVTGTPQVTISVTGSNHTISYVSGTTTAFLRFNYTVDNADVATPTNFGITSPLSLNSGTIKGTTNKSLTLTSITGTFLVGQKVFGGTSAATGVVKSWDSGGSILHLTQVSGTFTTEAVTVVGSGATLGTVVLDGDADVVRSVPVTAGGTLYFTPPLVSFSGGGGTGATAISEILGGIVQRIVVTNIGSGYTSVPTAAFGTQPTATISVVSAPVVPLTFGTAHPSVALVEIDAVLPTITAITAPAGTYRTGSDITFTVTFSKVVTVVGTPKITVNFAGTSTTGLAVYDSGTGTTQLQFSYTVQAADQADLTELTLSSPILTPGGSSVKDHVANPATLTHSATFPLVGANDDGGVIGMTLAGGIGLTTGDFVSGDIMAFSVLFDQVVTVTGSPTMAFNLNVTAKTAVYASGTGTNTLVFTYTTLTGDLATTSQITSGTTLVLAGGTIKDLDGDATALAFSQFSFTTASVNSAVAVGAATNLAVGNNITGFVSTVTVSFNENVTVATAVPYVGVDIGVNNRHFVYTSGSGTKSLVFAYTLVGGDVAAAAAVVIGAISLNSGTIRNANANNATLTFTPPVTTTVVVNDPAPTMSTPTIAQANYLTAQTIPVVVAFNKTVVVTGTPTIVITTTGGARTVNYASGTGTSSLTFNYTVVAGDTIGAVSSAATSLGLTGATIKDVLLTAATNSFVAASTFAGVATNDVEGTFTGTAVLANVTSAGRNPGVTATDVLSITITASKAATVTGSPRFPVVFNSNSRFFTYASGSGSTSLVFTYTTVTPGDVSTAGNVTDAGASPVLLNSGTIKDALGIPFTPLTFTAPNVSLVTVT